MFWVFVKNDWFSGFFSEEETRIKNEKSDFFERKPKKRGEGMIPIIFCDQEQYYKVLMISSDKYRMGINITIANIFADYNDPRK